MDGFTYLIKVDENGNVVLPALAKNADKADTSLRKIGTNSKTSFGSLERNARSSNAALGKTKSLLAGIGLTLTTGAIATGIISTGAGFEKSMSNVAALTGAAHTELLSLKDSARDAGATTAYSAKESADAMGYLAQAGYKSNQIINALPATLNLAAAGNMELARSADIATNILSQYQMKAQDTDVVVDQLAYTQANFNTNIEEMANAMNYFGPTAAAMKIGLSESNATIGLLANNGLKGSLATRALSSSIVRLTNPTEKMTGVINKLNLNFFDTEGRFVGLAGMVDTLNQGLTGLNDKQRQAALSTIFGAEAIQEINILLSEGGDKIRTWTEKLDNAQGAAKRMADTKLDNLAGDFQILKSTSQEFALGFYEQFSPTLRALTQEATLFVRGMDTKEVGLYAQKFFLSLRHGLIWLDKNKETLVKIGKAYVAIKVGMIGYTSGARAASLITGSYNTMLGLTKVSATGATGAVRSLNMAMKANPFGMVLGAITAVVSAVTLFRDRTKEATDAQKELNQLKKDNETEQSLTLRDETNKDSASLRKGNLNDRQIKSIQQSAQLRKEDLEDKLLGLEVKSGVDINRYLQLQKKWKDFTLSQEQMTNPTWKAENYDYDEYLTMQRRLKNSVAEIGGLGAESLSSLIADNQRIINKAKSLIKDETVTGIGAKGSGAGGSGTATEMSERIVSGGTSQKIVNVSLGKWMNDMVFNVTGGAADVIDRKEEILETFIEGFSRVLNSANQMSNG